MIGLRKIFLADSREGGKRDETPSVSAWKATFAVGNNEKIL